jgi:hypothetical protein
MFPITRSPDHGDHPILAVPIAAIPLRFRAIPAIKKGAR